MSIIKNTIAIAAASLVALSVAQAADVNVTIKGVRAGGDLYVSLQTQEQFMKQEGTAGEIRKSVAAGDETYSFKDIPEGAYALMVWHDLNANGIFDMSETGMPIDGWATSNGATLQGPPTFDLVKFDVDDGNVSLSESVIYFN